LREHQRNISLQECLQNLESLNFSSRGISYRRAKGGCFVQRAKFVGAGSELEEISPGGGFKEGETGAETAGFHEISDVSPGSVLYI
jgi:hypothetical protein